MLIMVPTREIMQMCTNFFGLAGFHQGVSDDWFRVRTDAIAASRQVGLPIVAKMRSLSFSRSSSESFHVT